MPGKKISKDKFSALLRVNASGTHRRKPVVVGKAAKPRCLKDQMDQLPVIYYNTCNSWFTAAIFEDWFFNHFIPEVWRYQEDILHIPPDKVKAILLLDNAPAHPHADRLISQDGRIRVVFLPPNTSLIQPLDQGVIMATKRIYTRKYLDEVLVVIPDEDDEIEDTRGLRTLKKIKSYNIKSGIYNFASAWKQVKISTLANCWKKLLQDIDPELDFEGFEPKDFHRVFQVCGEWEVSLEDVENRLDDSDADPGHQVMTIDEIADSVTDEPVQDENNSESEEEVVTRSKMAHVCESIDTLLNFVDVAEDKQIQGYYHHLRTLRELIIRYQYKVLKQIRLDKFFTPPSSSLPESESPPPSSQPPVSPTATPPSSPQPSTSAASADEFIGFK